MELNYEPKSETFWLATKPTKEVEDKLDAEYERIPGGYRWKKKNTNILTKVISAAKSITSGKASEETVARRRLSCFGNETSPPCTALKIIEGSNFCHACSCPSWRLSELTTKLTFAHLDCPLKRPGFSNEEVK